MEKQPKRNLNDFVGVVFKCCKIYSRIYKNSKGSAYVGWCPKCGRRIEFKISKNGTNDRFFEAEF